MVEETKVAEFLSAFKTKLLIWDVLFRSDRGKNEATLLTLNYSYQQVKQILTELEVVDYAQGPLIDSLHNGPDLWVFGKWIKEREVYIKITLGQPSAQVICISFHFAEYAMHYPFK